MVRIFATAVAMKDMAMNWAISKTIWTMTTKKLITKKIKKL